MGQKDQPIMTKVASKPQIVFEYKASIQFESGAYLRYVSILN